MGDLPRWKMMVSLWWVTYPSGKNNGLIVMGDLPKERWSPYDGWPTQRKNGLIMMGDLPKWKECEVRSHYDGWPTQVEDRKDVKWSRYNGWPTQVEDRKNVKWSHCYGWPTQMKGGLIMMGDLPKWKNVTYLAKRLGRWSPDRIRLTNGASWLQGLLENSSWW